MVTLFDFVFPSLSLYFSVVTYFFLLPATFTCAYSRQCFVDGYILLPSIVNDLLVAVFVMFGSALIGRLVPALNINH